jgi:hypothetical protein
MLFVITMGDPARWGQFIANVRNDIRSQGGVARLGENVWLVDMMQSAQTLACLVYWAGLEKLAYGLCPLSASLNGFRKRLSPRSFRAGMHGIHKLLQT